MPTNLLGPRIASGDKLASANIGFHIAFFESLDKQGPDPLMILADEVKSSTAVEEYFWAGDLPSFQEWVDDRPITNIDAYKFRITNKDWASGVTIYKSEVDDDRLGLIEKRIAGLAAKAARHRGDLLAKALLNGFAGTAYPEAGDGLAYDGAFFFSTAHSDNGSANQSNKLTSALTEGALETAEQMLAELKGAGGDPYDLGGTHLIVGPKLYPAALRLMNPGLVANAGGTLAVNNIHASQYQVIRSTRLTGTYDDYWFLADLSKPIKPLIFQEREAITTAAQTDWSTEDMFKRKKANFGAQARYNVGYYAWQTIIGSAVA